MRSACAYLSAKSSFRGFSLTKRSRRFSLTIKNIISGSISKLRKEKRNATRWSNNINTSYIVLLVYNSKILVIILRSAAVASNLVLPDHYQSALLLIRNSSGKWQKIIFSQKRQLFSISSPQKQQYPRLVIMIFTRLRGN